MNKNEIRKEIGELIDSIKQHSDEIGNQKRIPQIELELILSKIKRLYERSIVYNYLHSLEDETQVSVHEPQPYIAPSEPAPQPEIEDVVEVFSVPAPHTEHVVKHAPEPQHKDIKKLIGINEKFQFTKELFENQQSKYNAAIERINAARDKDELHTTLNTISSEQGWKDDHKTVQSFRKLAERIFS